jgi:translation initiation factor 4E
MEVLTVDFRETIKRVLSLPADTNMVWKSHDDSITQRSAIDQSRHDKTGHHSERRRNQTQTTAGEEKVAAS